MINKLLQDKYIATGGMLHKNRLLQITKMLWVKNTLLQYEEIAT